MDENDQIEQFEEEVKDKYKLVAQVELKKSEMILGDVKFESSEPKIFGSDIIAPEVVKHTKIKKTKPKPKIEW